MSNIQALLIAGASAAMMAMFTSIATSFVNHYSPYIYEWLDKKLKIKK